MIKRKYIIMIILGNIPNVIVCKKFSNILKMFGKNIFGALIIAF